MILIYLFHPSFTIKFSIIFIILFNYYHNNQLTLIIIMKSFCLYFIHLVLKNLFFVVIWLFFSLDLKIISFFSQYLILKTLIFSVFNLIII